MFGLQMIAISQAVLHDHPVGLTIPENRKEYSGYFARGIDWNVRTDNMLTVVVVVADEKWDVKRANMCEQRKDMTFLVRMGFVLSINKDLL